MGRVGKYAGKLITPDTKSDSTFAILQALFPDIQSVDKHIEASVTFFFNEAYEKIYKKDDFGRPSKRQMEKIRQYVIKSLRSRYGKWMTVRDLRWARRGGLSFKSNYCSTYKTSQGLLYGHSVDSSLREVFYTTHSLQRFEERMPEQLLEEIRKGFKLYRKYEPTTVDVFDHEIRNARDYGVDSDHRYLNIYFGALVIQTFRGVHIVKTFLTPEMLRDKDCRWLRAIPSQYDIENNDGEPYINGLTELFDHKTEQYEPTFLNIDDMRGEK